MKNKGQILLLILMIATLLLACGTKEEPTPNNSVIGKTRENSDADATAAGEIEDGQEEIYSFEAVILDNSNSLIMIPKEDSDLALSSDRLWVSMFEDGVVKKDKKMITEDDLNVGDIVQIEYNGVIRESYPAQITANTITVIGHHNLLDAYMAIVDDLYHEDEALNHEIEIIAIDTTNFYWEDEEQKRIFLAMVLQQYGLEVKEGTYESLVEEGFIDGENLYFEKGILIAVKGIEYNEKQQTISGEVSKWRSGLGAIGWDVKAYQKKSNWIVERKNFWIS